MRSRAARLTALTVVSAVALGLPATASATSATATPAAATPASAAPTATASPSATPASTQPARPTPAYPTAPGNEPSERSFPSPQPIDASEWQPGDKIVADGRVIPHVTRVTESIDFAVLYPVLPNANLDVLLDTARNIPLGNRKIMLTVDIADEGATEQDMREDAEATGRAMVQEQRPGMAAATVDTGQPRLKPGWVMATVMLPPASSSGLPDGGPLEPVVDLAVGGGVTATDDARQRLEEILAGHRNEDGLTEGLDELVRALPQLTEVDPGVKSPGQFDPGLFGDDDSQVPALGALLLVAVPLLLVLGIGANILSRRRKVAGAARGRGGDRSAATGKDGRDSSQGSTRSRRGGAGRGAAVVGKEMDPGWYAAHAGDPSLGLRHRLSLLGLALSAEGAHELPSGRRAVTALVHHTQAVEDRAGGLRESLRPGRAAREKSRAEDLAARAEETARLIGDLVREGHGAHPPVRFDPTVEDAGRQYAGKGRSASDGRRGWLRHMSRRSR